MFRSFLCFLIITRTCLSCTTIPREADESWLGGDGAYILNEGNFNTGNGSVSFFSYDSLKLFNGIFRSVNGRPLGDVPNHFAVSGRYGYIVINNSSRIEVVDLSTFESAGTVTGITSPREIAFVSSTKAYVSSMYTDSLFIVSPASFKVTGRIHLGRSSESLVVTGGKAYAANWVAGDMVMVINTADDKLVDSVKVGAEPESMVADRYKRLWILCNGGWSRQNFARLMALNTTTGIIEKDFVFPSKYDSPSCLRISGDGLTLFYLDAGVRTMSVNSARLPATAFIEQKQGELFYKIGINPVNGDIFVTDAVDYRTDGFVTVYDSTGKYLNRYMAGIIPGMICFRNKNN